MVDSLTNTLNGADLSKNTEVVVCPPSMYTASVVDRLRDDVAVGVQDVWYVSFSSLGPLLPHATHSATLPLGGPIHTATVHDLE